jgi:hypothetical protein
LRFLKLRIPPRRGTNMPAQGNALGRRNPIEEAL